VVTDRPASGRKFFRTGNGELITGTENLPKRKDIKKILIIGSGRSFIGQACEFDYSGAQACKALCAEGYEVVLVNSNPATIMTDPELAHRTYIEPLTKEYLEKLFARGKTGRTAADGRRTDGPESGRRAFRRRILEKYKVEMIGASLRAINGGGRPPLV